MADKTITGIVTWLKGWFYDKDEITTKENALQTQINNKASQSDLNTLSSTVSGKADSVHTHSSTDVTEASALSNIGTSANATQHDINSAIDTAISNLSSIDAINPVSTLPTASADTMGGLYIVEENSKVNVYYTEEDSGSYSWHKMDTDILDELSVSWSDIKNKPSLYTPSSHSHGDISNNGAISSSTVSCTNSDYPIIATYSDNWKLKRTTAISAQMVSDYTAHSNIGSSARSVQSLVNSKIDTAIGTINTNLDGKASKSQVIDWDTLTFVAKADDETGAITFDYLEQVDRLCLTRQ